MAAASAGVTDPVPCVPRNPVFLWGVGVSLGVCPRGGGCSPPPLG